MLWNKQNPFNLHRFGISGWVGIAILGMFLASCASKPALTGSSTGSAGPPGSSSPGRTITLPVTSEEFQYFMEIALGAEYGVSDFTVKKWNRDIYIQVLGHPTFADLQTLQEVINELNHLIGTQIRLHLVEEKGNVQVYFVPHSEFYKYEPRGVVFYGGFFWNWWEVNGEITRGQVVIASDEISQRLRSHLIREEITQVLGLMNDSMKYKDSIFFQGYSETTRFSEMDRAVIRFLYSNAVTIGMNAFQLQDLISRAQLKSRHN